MTYFRQSNGNLSGYPNYGSLWDVYEKQKGRCREETSLTAIRSFNRKEGKKKLRANQDLNLGPIDYELIYLIYYILPVYVI